MNRWQVNIKIWQDYNKIWQVNIIIWQVMAKYATIQCSTCTKYTWYTKAKECCPKPPHLHHDAHKCKRYTKIWGRLYSKVCKRVHIFNQFLFFHSTIAYYQDDKEAFSLSTHPALDITFDFQFVFSLSSV